MTPFHFGGGDCRASSGRDFVIAVLRVMGILRDAITTQRLCKKVSHSECYLEYDTINQYLKQVQVNVGEPFKTQHGTNQITEKSVNTNHGKKYRNHMRNKTAIHPLTCPPKEINFSDYGIIKQQPGEISEIKTGQVKRQMSMLVNTDQVEMLNDRRKTIIRIAYKLEETIIQKVYQLEESTNIQKRFYYYYSIINESGSRIDIERCDHLHSVFSFYVGFC